MIIIIIILLDIKQMNVLHKHSNTAEASFRKHSLAYSNSCHAPCSVIYHLRDQVPLIKE